MREGSRTARLEREDSALSSFSSLASFGGSQTARAPGGEEKSEAKRSKEERAVSKALAREALLVDRLVPVLDELTQDKRYFVRGETCRYILVSLAWRRG